MTPKMVKELKEENKKLKQELKEARNTKLLKRLYNSIKRIEKGRFLTRTQLGL